MRLPPPHRPLSALLFLSAIFAPSCLVTVAAQSSNSTSTSSTPPSNTINASTTISTNAATTTSDTTSSATASAIPTFPNPHYVSLLNDSLWFYEAQRSGNLPASNRVSWRHNSGLKDGADHNVSLVGGYYDAGDYLKFTLPLAYSLTVVAWGAIEWYQGYVLANQTDYLHDMIKWGTDWLIKAHPQDNVLYVQVGDGNVDNNYWGPDTNIPTPRPSYYIDANNHGTDVAAETAAALASAAVLFNTHLNNATYATTLLSHAVALFNFAESTPRQIYTNAVPAAKAFYLTSSYGDELVFAALWLYRATNSSVYLQKASMYFDQYKLAGATGPMDWSDQTAGVYVLGAKLDPSTTKYKTEAERYLDNLSNFGSPCTRTTGGLLWCDGYSSSNSLVPPQDTSLLALLYSPLNSQKSAGYISFALGQLNYLLGANPMLTPYVCGVHPNSPQNPHHAGASGGTDIGNINTSPVVEEYVLYGAIVGGPAQDDSFDDIRNDYRETEVALDYNAPFQGLIAYQVMHATQNPPYVNITQPRPARPPTSGKGLPLWEIVLIIVVVVVAVVVAVVAFCVVRRRRARKAWDKPNYEMRGRRQNFAL